MHKLTKTQTATLAHVLTTQAWPKNLQPSTRNAVVALLEPYCAGYSTKTSWRLREGVEVRGLEATPLFRLAKLAKGLGFWASPDYYFGADTVSWVWNGLQLQWHGRDEVLFTVAHAVLGPSLKVNLSELPENPLALVPALVDAFGVDVVDQVVDFEDRGLETLLEAGCSFDQLDEWGLVEDEDDVAQELWDTDQTLTAWFNR